MEIVELLLILLEYDELWSKIPVQNLLKYMHMHIAHEHVTGYVFMYEVD